MDTYSDTWIQCTENGIRVRGYYMPWGTKQISYESIRSMRRVTLSAVHGNLRIWGTTNPGYWASFDPGRPRKSAGFVLDVGRRVKPLLTPDDPDGFEAATRAHGVQEVDGEGGTASAPII